MTRHHGILFGLLTLTLLAGWAARSRSAGQMPSGTSAVSPSVAALKLEFGLKDGKPRHWEGTVFLPAGEIVAVKGWRLIPPDQVTAKAGWSLTTRPFSDPDRRWKLDKALAGRIVPSGVLYTLRGEDHTEVTVKTNHGEFSLRLGELRRRQRLLFLDGDVAAEYLPVISALTEGDATQHDFPSVATRGDDVFAAWTAYENEANFVYMAHRRNGGWTTHRASRTWGDYYGTATATEGAAGTIVAWSEFREDRWRLVSRRFDSPGNWGKEEYVKPSGRRQLFHRMVTDSQGAAWIAWQEFEGGNFEIYVSRHSADGWSPPLKVSESPANDWNPAIAASPDGAIYVAWDSYDAGNYDVFLRAYRNGRLGPVVQVTRSETYDAHPSIAVDPKGRVWLAWEEGAANWGKDSGKMGGLGSALGRGREVRLVCYEDGKFLQPSRPLSAAASRRLSSIRMAPFSAAEVSQGLPLLSIGPDGIPYLFFREYLFRQPRDEEYLKLRCPGAAADLQPQYHVPVHVWELSVAAFDGADWLPVRSLPESGGRSAMRSAAASFKNGLLFVWPTDGRSWVDARATNAQIRYAALESHGGPVAFRMVPFNSVRAGTPDAAPTEKVDLAAVRSVRWGPGAPLRLYRGDLHRHTDISLDGTNDGDIIDNYRYAIDAAALDFLGVTDHTFHERQNYFHYDWWRTRQIATMFDNPGHFAAFFGYERTVLYPSGHRNIISTRRELVPFRIPDEEHLGIQGYGERLFPYLRRSGDIAIPHTTATNQGTSWSANDPAAEPVAEIFQGFRGSYEEPDTPAKGPGATRPDGYLRSAWQKGLRVGVIASSDHHSTHQSYACAYAPELTARSIFQALKERCTFAATDNIILQFEATAGGRFYRMGQEIASAAPPEFRAQIRGTAPLNRVELIRNGSIVLSHAPGAKDHQFSYRDQETRSGSSYYYFRIVQANQQIAWSSPIWVDQ